METRYVQSLNESLFRIFEQDKKAYLIGEDIVDPYGGAFKVTKGLSSKYSDRVISTPISESAITGFATGMALSGFKPIVEIMFGDFITLIVDQLVNHACKYKWMYNEQVDVPLIIRTPMGGRRGYGPTHSQTLEQMFMSVPQLKIIAPSHLHDPGEILFQLSAQAKEPVLFIENKSLYPIKIRAGNRYGEFHIQEGKHYPRFPTVNASLCPFDEKADIALICYGGMTPIVLDAPYQIYMEEEINCHIIVPSLANPVPLDDIIQLLGDTRRVIICEESNTNGGWSGEVASQLYFKLFDKLDCPIQRLGAKPWPIPCSKIQEETILPQTKNIVDAITTTLRY